MENQEKAQGNAMLRLSALIVDKRNLVFLIVIIGLIFSAFSTNWVEVENELAEYLPDNSETRQGLDVMAEEYTTYGTAQIMVTNIDSARANDLYDELCAISGVQSICIAGSNGSEFCRGEVCFSRI